MLAAAERWGAGRDERPYLPRAFSIARHRDGESQFLLEDVGPGTRRLCELAEGERLWALGPLGRGFEPPPEGRRAILVGGGVGIAPLAILQDALEGAATVLLGFRDGARAAGASAARRRARGDATTARQGTRPRHRPAGRGARARSPRGRLRLRACGRCSRASGRCARRAGVPAQLALEAGMACGFGACFGCVVPRRGGGYLRVCVDGPVIDAAELERVDEHAGAPA